MIDLNKALWERVSAFEPQREIRILGPGEGFCRPVLKAVDGYQVLDNGSVIVRMHAPGANRVTVQAVRLSVYRFDVCLQKGEYGIFEGVIPADKNLRGNIVLSFFVDDCEVINPYIPVQFYGDRISNCIEVPDEETPYIAIRDVPHGAVTREIFWSETVGDWHRCMVYTPPGYHEGGEYPVLYLQHGGGENETVWTFNGKLPHIMDNLIADGKALPFVVVMNNGLVKVPGQTGMNDFDGIEGIICSDCRKHIESHYRVRTDKWSRAIAGLSLGSMQACYIGMRHPELFGAIGSFTYIRCRDKSNRYEENPHLDAVRDPVAFWQQYRLFFRSIGAEERHLYEFEEDDAFLSSCGVDLNKGYVRKVYPDMTHNWNCWRRAFHDFAMCLFK